MISKAIKIGDKEVQFKSSASIPRIYRVLFKRDIFADLQKLQVATNKKGKDGTEFAIDDLEIFENIAYCMAKHADPSVGNIDDWLDQFDMFSIYEILPEILELWGANLVTMVPVKNPKKAPGR